MWGSTGRSAARGAAIATVAAVVLGFAPAAQAAFGLTPTVAPASNDAGANADFKIDIAITEPEHDLRDLTIHLPPGLVGNPLATAQCTEEQLNADDCPELSDVGDVANAIDAFVLGIPVPLTVDGNLYNVVPRAGEPARFGIVLNPTPLPIPGNPLLPKIILQSAAVLRPSDLGLDSVLVDLPNTATVAGVPTEIDIKSLSLTLAGMAGDPPKGFIRLPTSCKEHTVGFDARAYDDQLATGQTTFTTTNCAALPFTPELSANVKQEVIQEGVELSTTISQTIEEAGLQRAQVTLPKDLAGNTTVLANQCPDASFQAGSCPESTIVGSAVAASPLQSQPLTGPVALVDTPAGNFPDLGIDLRGPLALKLKGTVGITSDIRNQVTFDGLPDIPISGFTLTFNGGPSGLNFANFDLCQRPPLVFDASFTAHSGATATSNPTATVTCSGGGGGGDGPRKKPKAKIKVGAESSDEPTLSVKIKAGSEKLKSASVKLPRQLSFASGKAFEQGAAIGKVMVKHTKRVLKLKTKKAVTRFAAKFANGAVNPGKGLGPHTNLTFKLKVRDAKGKATKLKVRGK